MDEAVRFPIPARLSLVDFVIIPFPGRPERRLTPLRKLSSMRFDLHGACRYHNLGLSMKRPLAAMALSGPAPSCPCPAYAATVDQVKSRGYLICGSNPGLPGFGLPDDKGNWAGFDIDFAAPLPRRFSPTEIRSRFVPLTAKDRFTALQSGQTMFCRATRRGRNRARSRRASCFPAVNLLRRSGFHGAQEARRELGSPILDGASICVQQGTTTELNLADYFRTQ